MKKTPKKVLKVTVSRKKWLRGGGASALLRTSNGKMCCLGFVCLASGNTKKEIANISSPQDVKKLKGTARNLIKKDPYLNAQDNTKVCRRMMDINDDDRVLSDKIREFRLKWWGKKAGIHFKFKP